jgi:hypothetical protein
MTSSQNKTHALTLSNASLVACMKMVWKASTIPQLTLSTHQ